MFTTFLSLDMFFRMYLIIVDNCWWPVYTAWRLVKPVHATVGPNSCKVFTRSICLSNRQLLILQFTMLTVRSPWKQEKCMFTWLYEPVDPTVRQPSNRVKGLYSFGVLVTWNLAERVRSIAISVSVCLSVCSHISKTTRPSFMQFSQFCGLVFLCL